MPVNFRPRDQSSPAQPISTRKTQSRKKPTYLCESRTQTMCWPTFDNHTILLFWLNKQTFRTLSLRNLCFVFCSRDLDVIRAQRIIGIFTLITHKSTRLEKPITWYGQILKWLMGKIYHFRCSLWASRPFSDILLALIDSLGEASQASWFELSSMPLNVVFAGDHQRRLVHLLCPSCSWEDQLRRSSRDLPLLLRHGAQRSLWNHDIFFSSCGWETEWFASFERLCRQLTDRFGRQQDANSAVGGRINVCLQFIIKGWFSLATEAEAEENLTH